METIKLDLVPGKKMPSLHASQYDDGREHGIDLFENGVAYKLDGTETLSIIVRKVDNTLVSMDIANVFGGKTYVDFLTTEQMCACAGYNFGELRIERNGERLGTGNFYLCVEEAPDEGGITSQSEINNLARQVHDIVVEELADNGAEETGYDNTESGLEATNVQDAIDEVNAKIENIPSVDAYTKEEADDKFATKTALEEVAGDIPTKTSELQNDSGFAEIDDAQESASKTYSSEKIATDFVKKNNAEFTGTFSLNRLAGSTVGTRSVAEGFDTTASGSTSHAEGYKTKATTSYAHAEGYQSEATGNTSHAEGLNTKATGTSAHTEGNGTIASGTRTHAEGMETKASGDCAHTEGAYTEATGDYSHAEGFRNRANHKSQRVFGEFNAYDDSVAPATERGNYVEIVGNGTATNARSNARTLDWNGNETLAGNLTFNRNKSLTSEISRLDERIDSKANASDVYTKSQTDNLLNDKANASDVYTKQATDELLNDKADVSDLPDMSQYYDKSEVDDLLDDKANSDDVYGKAYIDTALSGKANVGTSYTKSEEDALLANKADKTDTYTKEQVDDIVYNILPDDTASGSVANFTTSLELPIKSLEIDVNAVQESGTPTPATPLPISGRSVINLVKCGKNLYQYDESKVSSGTTTTSTIRAFYPMGIKGVCTLTFSASLKSGASITQSDYLNIGILRKSDGLLEILRSYINPAGIDVRTVDFSSGDEVILMSLENPTVIKSILSRYDLQIEVGSSVSTYESFNGTTAVINLGGTYYGGHFTQDKAGHRQLEVTYKRELLRNWTWTRNSTEYAFAYFSTTNVTDKANNKNFACEIFSNNNNYRANLSNGEIGTYNNTTGLRRFCVRCDEATTQEEFNTIIGDYAIIYELETPIVIDLPDGEPIITLNGTNNIYADTGDCAVEHKVSVEDYVGKRIASVQALILNT